MCREQQRAEEEEAPVGDRGGGRVARGRLVSDGADKVVAPHGDGRIVTLINWAKEINR